MSTPTERLEAAINVSRDPEDDYVLASFARTLATELTEALEALNEVMGWISNWTTPFTEDAEWQDTENRVKQFLATSAGLELFPASTDAGRSMVSRDVLVLARDALETCGEGVEMGIPYLGFDFAKVEEALKAANDALNVSPPSPIPAGTDKKAPATHP